MYQLKLEKYLIRNSGGCFLLVAKKKKKKLLIFITDGQR